MSSSSSPNSLNPISPPVFPNRDTQIAPLLREYWFDSPEVVREAVAELAADD